MIINIIAALAGLATKVVVTGTLTAVGLEIVKEIKDSLKDPEDDD